MTWFDVHESAEDDLAMFGQHWEELGNVPDRAENDLVRSRQRWEEFSSVPERDENDLDNFAMSSTELRMF